MINILSKKARGTLLEFTSANEKIEVNITESTNGPVFLLSDGSHLQFTDILQYYNVITDSEVYNIDTQTFDIDLFKSKYFVDSDDVDRYDISEVEEYKVIDKPAYRYILAV